jgi:hypothetical protein
MGDISTPDDEFVPEISNLCMSKQAQPRNTKF